MLAVACRDKKIRIYDVNTFQETREVILARDDNLISLDFHPQLENEILVLYKSNLLQNQPSDLRMINIISGVSQILVVGLSKPLNLICHKSKQELTITNKTGYCNSYGINQQGGVISERYIPYNSVQNYENDANIEKCKDEYSQKFYKYMQLQLLKNEQDVLYCYDPSNNDVALVGWKNGYIVLYNADNGQIITIFDKTEDNIIDMCYSKQESGQFFVLTQNTKQLLTFNISSKKPIQKRTFQQQFVQILPLEIQNSQQSCALLSNNGNVYILHNNELININPISHQSIVKQAIIVDNILYTGNSNGKINCIDLESTVNYQQKTLEIEQQLFFNSQFEDLQHKKSGISALLEYKKDYLVVAFNQGDICLVKRNSGQVVKVLISGKQFYNNDSINNQFIEIDDYYQYKSATNPELQTEKLRTVTYQDNILFTAWRYGIIRIFQIDLIKQSKLLAEINLLKLSGNNDYEDFFPMDIKIIDCILIICCSCGHLYAININQFLKDVKSLKDQETKQDLMNKNFNQYFIKNCQYTIFDLSKLDIDQKDIQGLTKSQIGHMNQNLILRQIAIKKASAAEQQFIQQQTNKKFTHLLLISTNVKVVRLFAFQLENNELINNKIFQLRQFSPLKHSKIEGNDLLGMKSVLFTQKDFEFICSGINGQSFIYQWNLDKQNQIILKTAQQKVDTCFQLLYQNNVLISCQFDGSIKFYNLEEFSQYQQYNDQIKQNLMLKHIYQQIQISNLQNTNSYLNQQEYNHHSLYLRAKSISYVLLLDIQKYFKFNFSSVIEKIQKQLQSVYQINNQDDLYTFITNKLNNNYSIINYSPEYNVNAFYNVINKFKYVITLLLSLFEQDYVAQIFYQSGLTQYALSLSQLCSLETKKDIMVNCYNLSQEQEQQNKDTCQRFQLYQIYNKQQVLLAKIIQLIQCQDKRQNHTILQIFKQLIQVSNPSIGYLVICSIDELGIIKQNEITEEITYIIKQLTQQLLYQNNIPQALTVLLQNMQDQQLFRLLFLMNDSNLCQYIQNQYTQLNINQYYWLPKVIMSNNQLMKNSFDQQVLKEFMQNQNTEQDQFTNILTAGLSIQQYGKLLQLISLQQFNNQETQNYQIPKLEEWQNQDTYIQILQHIITQQISKEQLDQYLEQLDINIQQIQHYASKILLLFKISNISYKNSHTGIANNKYVNLILMCGAFIACQLDYEEIYISMIQQADRAVRKLQYKQLTIQKELQSISFQDLQNQFQFQKFLQYRGRQALEVYQNDIYQILIGCDKTLFIE